MSDIRCSNCFSVYNDELGICPYCGYSIGDPPADAFCLAPGTTIHKRYIIGQEISSGGFGIVYKALDSKYNTIVAVKEYFPSGLVNRLLGENDVVLVAGKRAKEFDYGKKRFIDEARSIAQFNGNPNIVSVFDYFEENNTAYIVMEYLDGQTLSEHIQQQKGPLPYPFCLGVAIDICAALTAIHREKIVHRDVSPDNIMICKNGSVKLFDFGAARFSAEVTSAVTIVVKPGFAPPEQYEQVNRQDARTDIYALGATLYYVMTGVKPEESTDRKVKDTLVEPSRLNKQIPENVSIAIMRAMSVEPQYRYATADEFAGVLKNEIEAVSLKKIRQRKKLKRIVGIASSLLLIVVASGVFAWMYNNERENAGLPDADITVWYLSSADEEVDAAKLSALEVIAENFTNEYSNVSIEFQPISSYENSGNVDSEEAPSLIETTAFSDGELDSANLIDLSSLESALSAYSRSAYDAHQFPIGIEVPLIYINTSIGTVNSAPTINALQRLCSEASSELVADQNAADMFEAIYSESLIGYTQTYAKERFLNGYAMVYLGTSSDYLDVQESLPGVYSVIVPETDCSYYSYSSLWSVTQTDDDCQTVAEAFLEYLISDLAQDYIYIQERNPGLPVTESALQDYIGVYGELADVVDFLNLPFAD